MRALRAVETTEVAMDATPYRDVRDRVRDCQAWQASGRGRARHGGELSNDSDEGGNGNDEREKEFENLDLMSATARRPLTNTDEGER